jgi:hypothetical protein
MRQGGRELMKTDSGQGQRNKEREGEVNVERKQE